MLLKLDDLGLIELAKCNFYAFIKLISFFYVNKGYAALRSNTCFFPTYFSSNKFEQN